MIFYTVKSSCTARLKFLSHKNRLCFNKMTRHIFLHGKLMPVKNAMQSLQKALDKVARYAFLDKFLNDEAKRKRLIFLLFQAEYFL